MSEAGPHGDGRWEERPWLGRLLRVLVFLVPIVVSFVVALILSRWLGTPEPFWHRVGRWLLIALLATLAMVVMQRLLRRLLPLAALFSLTLVFPDETPSRFGLALRGMSARQLEKKMAEVEAGGLGDTPTEAAETLLGLVAALSRHDRLTRGHSERVRAYSVMIGEEMELDEDALDRLRWGALLHDVGKLRVPSEILNKRDRLTDDEFEAVKRHTVEGQALVAPLAWWLGESANAAFEHHERFSGGGYPTGAPAAEMALTSRIVAVADAFDVMTSARSYKAPGSPAEARAELQRCAGTQFDPEVVRAMLNISLGKLWRAMGPMSWFAQAGLFPRPVAQGGTAVSTVLAALLALLLTGFADAAAGDGGGPGTAAVGMVEAVAPGEGGAAGPVVAADGAVDAAGVVPPGATSDTTGITATTPTTTTTPRATTPATTTTTPTTTITTTTTTTTTTTAPATTTTTAPATTTISPVAPVTTTPPLPVLVTPTIATTTPLPELVAPAATTVPAATVPVTTVPAATVPAATVPVTTVPVTTVPVATVPVTTVPAATVPVTTVPVTTVPVTTVPVTTMPVTTVPVTTVPPTGWFALASPGTGDQGSRPVLGLAPLADGPQNAALPNYDTDRNADPGLTILRSPRNVDSDDPTEVQAWRFPSDVTAVDGTVTLSLQIAPTVAGGGGQLQVRAALFDCDEPRTACAELSSETVTVLGTAGVFAPSTFDLTPATTPTALAGRLELRIGVINGSPADIWVGYDAADTPSSIVLEPPVGSVPTPAILVPWSIVLMAAVGAARRRRSAGSP